VSNGQSETLTDVDGNYVLEGLESGTYTITFTRTGYKTYTEEVTIVEGDNVNPDVILTRFGKKTGKVIDHAGIGIEGVKVSAVKK